MDYDVIFFGLGSAHGVGPEYREPSRLENLRSVSRAAKDAYAKPAPEPKPRPVGFLAKFDD